MSIHKITAVIVDLDDCLWQGNIAEGQEPVLNQALYQFLLTIAQRGIQVFILSRNDSEVVHRALNRLGVDKEIFTAIVANWEPKYLSIERLLAQTNIRVETVVFIDDNELERTEATKKLPLIRCLDAIDWVSLQANGYLNSLNEQPRAEVAERRNRYRTAICSYDTVNQFEEDEDFLRSLDRKISVQEISQSPLEMDRVSRLLTATHRINFNPFKFTSQRHTSRYLEEKIAGGCRLFGICTWESGLALGLSGCFLLNIEDSIATIVDATFSCGIIGRDFEQRAMLVLIEDLRGMEIGELRVEVSLTSTNIRVREILGALRFTLLRKESPTSTYSLQLAGYVPDRDFKHIGVLSSSNLSDHFGIPSVLRFYKTFVEPLAGTGDAIVNLGSARGEVLGHLRDGERREFYERIRAKHIEYTKIDLEYVPGEDNIVADAEDLTSVVLTNSQNIVLAIELLEHTRHFWRVLDEIVRICAIGGYIFITVPTFAYPKHDYPIDLWRIGPKTLRHFFPLEMFEIVRFEQEGDPVCPRRILLLVKKNVHLSTNYQLPSGGRVNWTNGITIFE